MTSLKTRLLVLESLESQVEIIGWAVTTYENWPDPVPPDWTETFPGSGLWLTPELETPHGFA